MMDKKEKKTIERAKRKLSCIDYILQVKMIQIKGDIDVYSVKYVYNR